MPSKRKSINYGPSEKRDFHVYDKVFAKMRGYPPWPAKITNINVDPKTKSMKSKCEVYFYGTNQLGQCMFSDIHDYEANKERFCQTPKSIKNFDKALKEIEEDNGPLLEETGEEEGVVKLSFNDTKESHTEEEEADEGETPAKKARNSRGLVKSPAMNAKSPVLKRKTPASPATKAKVDAPNTKSPGTTSESVEAQAHSTDDQTKARALNSCTGLPKPRTTVVTSNKTAPSKTTNHKGASTPTPPVNGSTKRRAVRNVGYTIITDTKPKRPVQPAPTAKPKVRIVIGPVVDFTNTDSRDSKSESKVAATPLKRNARTAHKDTPRPRAAWNKSLEKTDPSSPSTFLASPTLEQDERANPACPNPSSRLSQLQTECTLLALESQLKKSLTKTSPDLDRALRVMEEILELQLTDLMLKKNPQVVDTFRKIQRYNADHIKRSVHLSERPEFDSKVGRIRDLASRTLGEQFPALFSIPRGSSFIQHYRDELVWYLLKIADRPQSAILSLTTHDI